MTQKPTCVHRLHVGRSQPAGTEGGGGVSENSGLVGIIIVISLDPRGEVNQMITIIMMITRITTCF